MEVETTEVAEFDIQGYQISDATMERIGKRLKAVTISPEDRVEGHVRVRHLEGYEVMFVITRFEKQLVITIGGLVYTDKQDPEGSALKLIEKIATFRGAIGL